MGFKDFMNNLPVANWGGFALHKDGTVEKLAGPDRGRHSLEGAVVELDEGATLEKRVTATRFVALGLFSLMAKKKSGGERYLLIAGDGFSWLQEVPRKQVPQAVKFYQQVKAAQLQAGRST